ncbi:hypothetical protein GLAREA_08599 [Glarea lozoyensis ATCC 20868]|uniref:BTB domain-containing protein n=1 Tax=Glarea lozoyensis (strain ATCC 20868 / MF5171) TaxID=1116229 RepID=S3CY63_GLAL2|nr:uncharacterized protein GLAREA_08599 [Glarea lozoyensis ATCC 20868]EPE24746.1 hypothetical protein GLAREA_08599 [Glarea lozoyensis ATCC 20868]
MSSRPRKKQKLEVDNEPENKPPIVFKFKGFELDTKLTVFSQEFHVHSSVLKVNSIFFRTFLDSADKKKSDVSAAGKFRYKWITQIDDDGEGWHFVCDNAKNKVNSTIPSTYKDFNRQEHFFHTIMRAIHGLPYNIKGWADIECLTDLADYYGALRSVSAGLGSATLTVPNLFESLKKEAFKVLPLAIKLRNENLFRDCVIWCMGPYDNPQRRKIKDENLRAVVKKISERLDERVREVEARITEYFPKTGRKVSRSYPSYFLDKSESMAYEIGKGEHSAVFGDILKNSLILQPELEAGDYEADNYFLNVKLTAEDIPWDTKEVDW